MFRHGRKAGVGARARSWTKAGEMGLPFARSFPEEYGGAGGELPPEAIIHRANKQCGGVVWVGITFCNNGDASRPIITAFGHRRAESAVGLPRMAVGGELVHRPSRDASRAPVPTSRTSRRPASRMAMATIIKACEGPSMSNGQTPTASLVLRQRPTRPRWPRASRSSCASKPRKSKGLHSWPQPAKRWPARLPITSRNSFFNDVERAGLACSRGTRQGAFNPTDANCRRSGNVNRPAGGSA